MVNYLVSNFYIKSTVVRQPQSLYMDRVMVIRDWLTKALPKHVVSMKTGWKCTGGKPKRY